MKPRAINWLACPRCGGDFRIESASSEPVGDREVEAGMLVCGAGHRFPIVAGVPHLGLDAELRNRADAESIRASFSAEWAHFDFGDRTWGTPLEVRREEFLRHVNLPAEALEGKLVLDAGCGNGSLSHAISTLGCDVLAADIGEQVDAAHHHYADRRESVTYAQADLMNPPFKPGTFDVVFCAGVLHHTPSTFDTFQKVIPALAPGGTVFVWLYHAVPGRLMALKSWLRRGLSRLPSPVKHAIVAGVFLPQAMLRQHIRTLRGVNDERDRLKWRERLVILLDSYTPRYRWEHTPEELAGWYRDLGFEDIEVTERGQWGFGVAARRPAPVEAAVA